MDCNRRDKKLRMLVKKLNSQRKKQAKKIDILCNDLIGAQRNFIKRLSTVAFAATFYKAIVGVRELEELFLSASRLIKGKIANADVIFFLRNKDSFDVHLLEDERPISGDEHRLENCFTVELVENICKANRPCTLDEMPSMGLQASPAGLKKLSAVTIPLVRLGQSVGFILVCRSSQNKLTIDELGDVLAVSTGLSQAVECGRGLLAPVD